MAYEATASRSGSTTFFVLSLLSICALVLLLLRYYLPLRATPAYVTVPVFLSIALPASIVLLVPIDLASSAATDTDGGHGVWLPEKVVYKSWRITYWLTFALTWVILPYLGEYCDSGYRAPRDRFTYAVRSNGRYQLIMLGSAILGAIYILWQNGFHWESFKGLVMALAYTWGLILAIYLMGHGLVAFPRTLYRYASVSTRLKMLQSQAPRVHEKLTESIEKLDQYEYQVLQLRLRKQAVSPAFQDWIEELYDATNLPDDRARTVSATGTAPAIPAVITDRYLAELTRKIKRARHAKTRFTDEWDRLITKAMRMQAILDARTSSRLEFRSSPFDPPSRSVFARYTLLTPYTRYLLHARALPGVYYTSALVASLASLAIIWSECVRALDPKLSLIGLTVIQHPSPSSRGRISFPSQTVAAAWLSYMCLCAFYSLTEVRVWGNRALVPHGTYHESATWYSLQVAKLTVPLAYNFITFVPPVVFRETGFHKFLGRLIDLTPLGSGFSDYFPVFVLVPVVATLFGLYGKVRNICGFGDLLQDEEEEEGAGGGGDAATARWREGRALIDRELHGASGSAVGLTRRDGTTTPEGERYSYPYSDSEGAASHSRSAEAFAAQRNREARRRAMEGDEDVPGNFFTDFTQRVKNTFDANDFGFTRPRWMDGLGGGSGSGSAGASGSGNAGGERNDGWRALFGGRAEEGRVRL